MLFVIIYSLASGTLERDRDRLRLRLRAARPGDLVHLARAGHPRFYSDPRTSHGDHVEEELAAPESGMIIASPDQDTYVGIDLGTSGLKAVALARPARSWPGPARPTRRAVPRWVRTSRIRPTGCVRLEQARHGSRRWFGPPVAGHRPVRHDAHAGHHGCGRPGHRSGRSPGRTAGPTIWATIPRALRGGPPVPAYRAVGGRPLLVPMFGRLVQADRPGGGHGCHRLGQGLPVRLADR